MKFFPVRFKGETLLITSTMSMRLKSSWIKLSGIMGGDGSGKDENVGKEHDALFRRRSALQRAA